MSVGSSHCVEWHWNVSKQ